jgi:hypothetical protein
MVVIAGEEGTFSGTGGRTGTEQEEAVFVRVINRTNLMNTAHNDPDVPASELEDDLLHLQLQVAHRADELWRTDGRGRGSELEFWFRAEREVLERRLSMAAAELHEVS